jgi:hypothetical protein
MARAMLLFERQADSSWLPTTVILATPKRLQGKCLPGSPDRDARLAMLIRDAGPPRINDQTEERGTFDDWIGWAVNALANGHTTWVTEVVPSAPVEALYEREVLGAVRADVVAGSGTGQITPRMSAAASERTALREPSRVPKA